MYNPKSLKAEEFIDNQEILDTIAYAEANKNNVELIDAILERRAPRKTETASPVQVFRTVRLRCFLLVKSPKK